MASPKIESRLRAAGVLIALGLLIQLATLFSNHPLAFMAFLGIGVPIAAAGILVYLISLLKTS